MVECIERKQRERQTLRLKRQLASTTTKFEREKSKGDERTAAQKEETQKMRIQRDQARAQKREFQRRAKALQGRLNAAQKVELQLEAAEVEAVNLAMDLEDAHCEVDDTTKDLIRALDSMSSKARTELDVLVARASEIDTEGSVSLIEALGKRKGERWSQDIIELGAFS